MSVLDFEGSSSRGRPVESVGLPEDRTLRVFLGRAQHGGTQADRIFFALAHALPIFEPFAMSALPRFLRPIYGPDDIIQESYLGLLKNRATVSFPEESKLWTWFRGVIGMKVVSLCRRQFAMKRTGANLNSGTFHLRTTEEIEGIPSNFPSAEEEILREEKVQWALNEIGYLSPRACLLIIHHCYDGLPVGEVASRLGLGSAEASRLLYSTKKKIRERFMRIERQEERGSLLL